MESSGARMKNRLISYSSPFQLVVIIAAFIFVIELFLMVSLHSILPSIPITAEVLLDSTLLVVLLSPLLYLFLYRPLTFYINERKRSEEVLRESETSLENAQRIARMGNWEWNIGKNELYWSDQIYRIFGLIPQEFGATYEAFLNAVHPDDRELVKKSVNDAVYEKMPYDIDHRILLPDGSERVVHEQAEVFFDDAGRAIKMIGTVQDITERKWTEEFLRSSEERYKRLVESVTDYIYTVEVKDGLPVSTSHGPGCVAVTGYTSEEYEADPNLWSRMVYEEDRKGVIDQGLAVLSGKVAEPIEHRIIQKDGSIIWVRNTPVPRYDEHGRLVAYDGLIKDITERRKLEDQLRYAQKMEAIGTLTGGIAHDFNNIITAVIGYCSLLKMKMVKDDPLVHNVDQIISLTEKAANLAGSLLAFSRKQVSRPKQLNLNETINRTAEVLMRLIGEDIELKIILTDKELPVMADSGQIEQVLMNLCTNARDAMQDGGGLTIETEVMEMDSEFTREHGYGSPGIYALLSVTDTGIGMDEKTKEKIFEPFFTTKGLRKGTGLGLSMAYGIIKQHKGYINVQSELGKGARFNIYLPVVKSVEAEENKYMGTVVPVRGTETILLAEDELFLREVTKEMFEEYGYKVIDAVDGEDAMEKFMKNKDDVQLLLLDAIMPKKNGKEVYMEIRKIRPDIKTVFLSGYSADVVQDKGIHEEGLTLISKPISPAELLIKIREVLDR